MTGTPPAAPEPGAGNPAPEDPTAGSAPAEAEEADATARGVAASIAAADGQAGLSADRTPSSGAEPPAPANVPEPAVEPARRAGRRTSPLLAIAETVVITIAVFALTQAFVARTYAVQQTSMQQTLEPGERIFVDELTPRFDPYKRGDIVVFNAPAEAGAAEPLVKRVIGVAGDTVQLVGGRVVVNGKPLVEPYVYGSDGTLPYGDQFSWTIPAGYIFVMGDHRDVSRDSREFGPIPVSSVIGRAWLRFYPLDTFGLLAGH